MSIFRRDTIHHSYPAYDVMERQPTHKGEVNLVAGETLIVGLSTYTIGSVASYALANGECPYEARDRAVGFGHELYYIFGNGACLTAHKQERKRHILVAPGMRVHFEGKSFIIKSAPNNNLRLEEVAE